jgi:hypothetical protein
MAASVAQGGKQRGPAALAFANGGTHGDQQTDRRHARKGAVRKRSQLKVKVAGEDRWTKRNKGTGVFMAQTKIAKKFKGVRREY